MRKWVAQAVVSALGGTLLLAGLLFLGREAGERLHDERRCTASFAGIECEPQGSLDRPDFLTEVQYLGGLPDQLDLLDPELPSRLARVFANHPWVEEVRRVEVTPPRRIRIHLAYRTPVLAVSLVDRTWDGNRRGAAVSAAGVVDRHGVLLPQGASTVRLPVLAGRVRPPSGRAGTAWGDARVEAAARTAGLLHPYQDRLSLTDYRASDANLILMAPGVRILWGRSPGTEEPEEAPAAVKLQRLLDYQAQHQGLTGEHDVRPRDRAIHRPPLPPRSHGPRLDHSRVCSFNTPVRVSCWRSLSTISTVFRPRAS
jgi:hypothetical protein